MLRYPKVPGSCHFQKSPWVFFRCRAYTLPLNLGDTYLSEEQPDPKGEWLRVSINPHASIPSHPIPSPKEAACHQCGAYCDLAPSNAPSIGNPI